MTMETRILPTVIIPLPRAAWSEYEETKVVQAFPAPPVVSVPVPVLPSAIEQSITKALRSECLVFGEGCDMQYAFLSNDYPCSFEFGGRQYSSATAAYEAQKLSNRPDLMELFTKLSPEEALALSAEKHRDKYVGWYDKRLETMFHVLKAKFGQNPDLLQRILLTADAYLLFHTSFKHMDSFWSDDCDGSGANHFGRTLMQVRKELGGMGEPERPAHFDGLLPKVQHSYPSPLDKHDWEIRSEIDELNSRMNEEDYQRHSGIARRQEHMEYTRFRFNNFPYDKTLVPLSSGRYINANFIYGKQFIGTQSPMQHTTEDFWSMVYEHSAAIVIMLNRLGDPGDDIYFPFSLEDIRRYGSFRLELAEHPLFMTKPSWRHSPHEEEPHAVIHRKVVLHKEGQQPRRVHHFQYQNWRDMSAGNERATAHLVVAVHKVWEEFPESPVVVHCHAGVGRTAVVITLLDQYKILRASGQIDVKRSVERQRSPTEGRCHSMMQSSDQYAFCYRVLRLLA
jgi:ribA/ribD-fused uncharacterized protein